VNFKDPEKSYANLYGKEISGNYIEKDGKKYFIVENDGNNNKLEYEFSGEGEVDEEGNVFSSKAGECASRSWYGACEESASVAIRPNRVKINGEWANDGSAVKVDSDGRMTVVSELGDGFNILQTNGQDNDMNDALSMAQASKDACQGINKYSVYHVINTTGGTWTDTMNSRSLQKLTRDDIENNSEAYQQIVANEPALATIIDFLKSGKVNGLNAHSQG
jgi:hypothetical protein